jgi:methyl-accepting chemotaxis protein
LTIGRRLAIGFAVVIGVTILITLVGLGTMRGMNRATEELRVRYARVALAQRGVALINENARLALRLFVVADAVEYDRQVAAQAERSRVITSLYSTFERELDSNDERELFRRVLEARNAYTTQRASAEIVLRSSQRAAAQQAFDVDVLPKLVAYVAAWEALLTYEGDRMRVAEDAAAQAYVEARRDAFVLLLVAALGGTAAAIIIARRIT